MLTKKTRVPVKKKTTHKSTSKPRKQPSQERSRETVAVILEAAARILESRGIEGYNTNAVAEKAGVSIGSLYQYFPGKDALTLRSVAVCRRMRSLGAQLNLWRASARSSYQIATLRRVVASVRTRHERRPRKARPSRFPLEILPGRQIPDLFVG